MATRVMLVNDTPHKARAIKNGKWFDAHGLIAQSKLPRGIKAKRVQTERVWDATCKCWRDAWEMRPQFGYKRDKWGNYLPHYTRLFFLANYF